MCGWELEGAQSASAVTFPSLPHLQMRGWVCVLGTVWFLWGKVIGFLFCEYMDIQIRAPDKSSDSPRCPAKGDAITVS